MTRRRVIFPPTDYWTRTDQEEPVITQAEIPAGLIPEAIDLRRAAAMLLSADPMTLNVPAIADIITEVKSDLRITELMVAMSVLAHQAPDLGTDEGQRSLWASWHHYKAIEDERKHGND